MDDQPLGSPPGRLETFLEPLLPLFGRAERRRWGLFYVRSLLAGQGRPTAAGMAKRYGGDEQAVQQFISQSPWEWLPIRRQLAARMNESRGRSGAWLVRDFAFPKKGGHSVGVAHQTAHGRYGNFQVAAALLDASDEGCYPVDVQLYLPEFWLTDVRRAKAGIPEELPYKQRWQLALEMIEQAHTWGLARTLVVADESYGGDRIFREAIVRRGLSFLVGIPGDTLLLYDGRGARHGRPEPTQPGRKRRPVPTAAAAQVVIRGLSPQSWRTMEWREGSRNAKVAEFVAVRARVLRSDPGEEAREPFLWLLAQRPTDDVEPNGYWLSDLPDPTTLRDLVFWAKLGWWATEADDRLRQVGMDQFEGRSWVGWHHHITLAMAAADFRMAEEIAARKPFWVGQPPREGVALRAPPASGETLADNYRHT